MTEVTLSPEEQFRHALLRALRAPNPDYNMSLNEANVQREFFAGLGIRIDLVAAVPCVIVGSIIADLVTERDLEEARIDPDLPLNLHARFAGRQDLHNMGLLRKSLRPGAIGRFKQAFADIYGAVDPAGHRAEDCLMNLPTVASAIQDYLSKAV